MRLAFFVNEVATEIDEYTTTRLARAAAQRGHEVWYVGLEDVELGESNGQLTARAHASVFEADDTLEKFMERVKERDAQRIVMDDLDALFLRNESIEEWQERPWASPMGVVVGQMLQARGVTVVNDPTSLMRATSKLYLEEFPEEIRPRSLVTRDSEAIERFVAEVGPSVVKPLYGAKGRNVFVIKGEDETNLAQITEAVLQDGYAIVQQFVEGGEDGDARIFLLEGQILEHDGQLAAFRRVPTGNDPRANISTGGRAVPLQIGDVERGIVEAMSSKLVADGMFFVGIDVIGDKVLEINAESPGGMQGVERLYEIDVCPTVIEALERRSGLGGLSRGSAGDGAARGGHQPFGVGGVRGRLGRRLDQAQLDRVVGAGERDDVRHRGDRLRREVDRAAEACRQVPGVGGGVDDREVDDHGAGQATEGRVVLAWSSRRRRATAPAPVRRRRRRSARGRRRTGPLPSPRRAASAAGRRRCPPRPAGSSRHGWPGGGPSTAGSW